MQAEVEPSPLPPIVSSWPQPSRVKAYHVPPPILPIRPQGNLQSLAAVVGVYVDGENSLCAEKSRVEAMTDRVREGVIFEAYDAAWIWVRGRPCPLDWRRNFRTSKPRERMARVT